MTHTYISKVIVNIILFFFNARLVVLWERLLKSPTLDKKVRKYYTYPSIKRY